MGQLQAVVFDFDGLLVDSETSIYELSAAVLREMGHDLTIEQWAAMLGRGPEDSWKELCRMVGTDLDRAEYERLSEAQDRSAHESLPLLPGAWELFDALDAAGVPFGVASSSSARWVVGHLTRLGVIDRFTTAATRDRVGGRSKPAPDAYLLACADIGADPALAVAIEDSAPGIAAGLAAGMRVLSVPSHITAHTDLSAAHASVAGLPDITIDLLESLVER